MSKVKIRLLDGENEPPRDQTQRLVPRGLRGESGYSGRDASSGASGDNGGTARSTPAAALVASDHPVSGCVLLVDDEREYIRTLAERLRLRGFAVEVAYSGQEAMRKVSTVPTRVAVLDYAMPGMDGIETLKLLRRCQPELRFLLLTGQATIKAATEAARLGAVDILEKPTDMATLVERLRTAGAWADNTGLEAGRA